MIELGRNKIIQLGDRFETGEPTVQPVLLWGLHGKACYEPFSKYASQSPALDYIKSIQPVPGRTIVLVIGLGSFERYGLNRNGDGFPEHPYKTGVKPTCGCCGHNRDAWILPEECIQNHYQSYENGHVFRHHVNKDPKKSIGRILKAFWNPFMHRIEILEDIDNAKAPDLVEQISDGEFPAKSMGCFPAGTQITTREGLCPIQQIDAGTLVLTHKGAWKKVTELHRRPYSGKLYVIHTPTGDSPATGEHPYGVLPQDVVEEYVKEKSYWRRRPSEQITLADVKWRHAECLSPRDYLITPFDTSVKDTLSVDQCALLGYYVAEGHIIFQYGKPYGVEFNHNIDDAAVTELPALLERLTPQSSWHQHDRTNSDQAAHTYVYDADLATFCMKHARQYAHTKRLSQEVMQQDREQQLALLGKWVNGDGGTTPTSAFYVCSCNDQLMRQAQTLGFRCGLYGRHHVITHKPSTIVDKITTEYRVEFARRGCDVIAPYTVKVAEHTMKGASTGPFFIEGAVVSRITDISVFDFAGPVYNFEVEDDESYVAENHAVHNCRIKFDVCTECGHQAPTRKQYCDHLKWEMGQLNPKTGIRKGALNPNPKLFDSSWVIRPADRTGYMLKKVADIYEVQGWGTEKTSSELGDLVDALNEKSATAKKLAVIDKIVRGYPAGIVQGDLPEANLIEKYKNESAPSVVSSTPELSHEDLSTLAPHNLGSTLAALSNAGILLTTPEFVQLFIEKAMPGTQVPRHVLDNMVGLQSEFFNLFEEHPTMLKDLGETLTPGTNDNSDAIKQAIAPLLEKRSTLEPYLYRRLTPKMFRHDEPPRTDLMEYVDPQSGRLFQTTRGASRQAEDSIAKSKLLKLLGSGGLLAGAYKAALTPGLRLASLPLAGGSWLMGQNALKATPSYKTTSGEDVPYLTEFREKQNSLMDLTTNLAMDYGLTKTGSCVIQRIQSRVTSAHPLHLFMQKLSSFGLHHPALSLNRVMAAHEKTAQNGITDAVLDLQKTAEVVGTLVWLTS